MPKFQRNLWIVLAYLAMCGVLITGFVFFVKFIALGGHIGNG